MAGTAVVFTPDLMLFLTGSRLVRIEWFRSLLYLESTKKAQCPRQNYVGTTQTQDSGRPRCVRIYYVFWNNTGRNGTSLRSVVWLSARALDVPSVLAAMLQVSATSIWDSVHHA